MTKWVYDFAEGSKDMRELLGGKGAGIAEMTRVLGADRHGDRTGQSRAERDADELGRSRRAGAGGWPRAGRARTDRSRSGSAEAVRVRGWATARADDGPYVVDVTEEVRRRRAAAEVVDLRPTEPFDVSSIL